MGSECDFDWTFWSKHKNLFLPWNLDQNLNQSHNLCQHRWTFMNKCIRMSLLLTFKGTGAEMFQQQIFD